MFSFLMFPTWRVPFKEKYTSKFTHGDIKLIYCQVNVEGPHPDPSLAEFRRTINLDRILTSVKKIICMTWIFFVWFETWYLLNFSKKELFQNHEQTYFKDQLCFWHWRSYHLLLKNLQNLLLLTECVNAWIITVLCRFS